MVYYPMTPWTGLAEWENIKGKPYITVSAKGIANGLSDIPNDGADFGPDTPGTQTSGIQEAYNYLNSNGGGTIQLTPGVFLLNTNIVQPSNGFSNILLRGASAPANSVVAIPTSSTIIQPSNSFSPTSTFSFNLPVSNTLSPSFAQRILTPLIFFTDPSTSLFFENFSIYGTSPNGSIFTDGILCYGVWNGGYRNISAYNVNINAFFYLNHNTAGNSFNLYDLIAYGSHDAYSVAFIFGGYSSHAFAINCVGGFSYGLMTDQNPDGNNNYYSLNLAARTYAILNMAGYIKVFGGGTGYGNGGAMYQSGGNSQFYSFTFNNADSTNGFPNIYDTSGHSALLFDGCIFVPSNGTTKTPYAWQSNGSQVIFRDCVVVNADLYTNFPFYNANNPSMQLENVQGITLTPTISANPPVTATVYQNTNPFDIEILLPVYATTAGTAGTVAWGISATSTVTEMTPRYVNGATSSTAVDIITVRVPAGWYYEFTASGVTFGTATVLPA